MSPSSQRPIVIGSVGVISTLVNRVFVEGAHHKRANFINGALRCASLFYCGS